MAKQFVKISSVRGKQGGSAGGESIKVASFQNVQFVCPIFLKKFQITILNLKFEFPAHNNKQLIKLSSSGLIWNIYFGDLKNTSHSLKKASFTTGRNEPIESIKKVVQRSQKILAINLVKKFSVK